MKKIYIGADHAGFELKQKLIPYLIELGNEVIDKGAFVLNPEDDYPDFIMPVAQGVSESPQTSVGIIIGGSGQGEAMVANRFFNVRAAVYYGPRQTSQAVDVAGRQSVDPLEILRLSKEHNNANVLSLAARFLTEEEAKTAVKTWLEASFKDEERHLRRVRKLEEDLKNVCRP